MLDLRSVTEPKTWNDLVQTFPASDLRQGFEWGEQRRDQGWAIHRFAVFDGDECVAATTVQARALSVAGSVMYAPRGPLWRIDRPDALAALLDGIRGLARGARGVFLRISPGLREDDVEAATALKGQGFRALPDTWTVWNAPRHLQILDVRADEPTLLAAVRERYRRYIRAARRRAMPTSRRSIASSSISDDSSTFRCATSRTTTR